MFQHNQKRQKSSPFVAHALTLKDFALLSTLPDKGETTMFDVLKYALARQQILANSNKNLCESPTLLSSLCNYIYIWKRFIWKDGGQDTWKLTHINLLRDLITHIISRVQSELSREIWIMPSNATLPLSANIDVPVRQNCSSSSTPYGEGLRTVVLHFAERKSCAMSMHFKTN